MSDGSKARPVVGVVGGGQLAQMMAPAAGALGIELRALVTTSADPAAQVLPSTVVGDPGDLAAVTALLRPTAEAAPACVLTWEHEHIPADVLAALTARGVTMRPAPAALIHAQDKAVMRARLTEAGIPCPQWRLARGPKDVAGFLAEHSMAVAKTPRGGYDGRGVRTIDGPGDVDDWLTGGPVLLEERIDFSRELTVLLARRPSGEIRSYPVVETVQRDGICFEVTAPALGLDTRVAGDADALARRVAQELDVTGVLAVELFQLREQRADGARVVVNELAMRPHNSGHWTIDGAVTDQFEQHLRAVLDLPLGATSPRQPWAIMVNVLGTERTDLAAALPHVLVDDAVRVHLYGKTPRPGRKLGHVTVVGKDVVEIRRRAQAAAAVLRGDAPTLDAAYALGEQRGGDIW